jgi:hypothetical protein
MQRFAGGGNSNIFKYTAASGYYTSHFIIHRFCLVDPSQLALEVTYY